LKGDARHLIDRKYMPRLDILQDPRNMQKEDIVDFLNHVHARQEAHGVAEAFRFSHYIGRNNAVLDAKYPDGGKDGQVAGRKKMARKGSKKKGKG
jgi:hypothetical protein